MAQPNVKQDNSKIIASPGLIIFGLAAVVVLVAMTKAQSGSGQTQNATGLAGYPIATSDAASSLTSQVQDIQSTYTPNMPLANIPLSVSSAGNGPLVIWPGGGSIPFPIAQSALRPYYYGG